MDPIFTLTWPEFAIAEKLQKLLPRKDGYSILIPLSRQEKGIDLAILKTTTPNKSAVTTIQVKASRTYLPKAPKLNQYQYTLWFKCFDVPERADFIILHGMYPINLDRPGKGSIKWYRDCTISLVFTNEETINFFKECTDKMFYFGFNDLSSIILTRGMGKNQKDFSPYLLENRLNDIKRKLDGEEPKKLFL